MLKSHVQYPGPEVPQATNTARPPATDHPGGLCCLGLHFVLYGLKDGLPSLAKLLNIRLTDGRLRSAGKEVTGFSNEEERLAKLDEHVPFLTEDELKKRGALYRKADQPFTEFAVASERLVTGQNPQSGAAVAERVLALLEKSRV